MNNNITAAAADAPQQGTRRDFPALTKDAEDALIRRAVRGECGAMHEICARYRGLILSEARASYLRNAALAPEAESIASLAFLEALHDYDPGHGAPFAALAKSRVHGALYTAFRRARRDWMHTCHPEQDGTGDCWAHCGGTTRPTEAADLRLFVHDILRHAMQRLTEREKAVLSLHFFRDLTLCRIASLLKTSPNAISKCKANLVRKLRAAAFVLQPC